MAAVRRDSHKEMTMIDKREGETKKAPKSQGSYTPRDEPKPHGYEQIPSQRKAPEGPKTGA